MVNFSYSLCSLRVELTHVMRCAMKLDMHDIDIAACVVAI